MDKGDGGSVPLSTGFQTAGVEAYGVAQGQLVGSVEVCYTAGIQSVLPEKGFKTGGKNLLLGHLAFFQLFSVAGIDGAVALQHLICAETQPETGKKRPDGGFFRHVKV